MSLIIEIVADDLDDLNEKKITSEKVNNENFSSKLQQCHNYNDHNKQFGLESWAMPQQS